MTDPKYVTFDPERHNSAAEQPERKPAGWKERQAARRSLAQTWARLNKCVTDMFELRKTARKFRRLDEVQDLTEAIFNTKLAITHLRHIARREFDKSLEELEVYK